MEPLFSGWKLSKSILGVHLLVLENDQWKQLDPATLETRPLPSSSDIEALNAELPVIGRSLNDLISLSDSLLAAIENYVDYIDVDQLRVVSDDLDTAAENLSLSVEDRSRLFRATVGRRLRRLIS